MLFETYIESEKAAFKADIESMWDEGVISLERITDRGVHKLGRIPDMLETAEWFEEAHDDDLSKTAYRVVDETDDEFPDAPNNHWANLFIHKVHTHENDGQASSICWNEDKTIAVVVFEEHETYPQYDFDA